MNCKKIRELILTDYTDNRLDEKTRKNLDEHLAACPGCASLATSVKKYAIEPFKKAVSLDPPERLWDNIRAAIEPEATPPFAQVLIDNFLRLISLPKSIFTLSSALALILIAFVSIRSPQFFVRLENHRLASAYLEEEMETIASTNGTGFSGLETSVEKYLL